MASDVLEVTQKAAGHLPFLKPILQERSWVLEIRGFMQRALSSSPQG